MVVLFPLFWGISTSVMADPLNAIQSIRFDVPHQVLTVISTSQISPQIQYLKNPQKIVLDLPDTVFPSVHQEISNSIAGIEKIRISQFQNQPPTVRMVMDLQYPMEVSVRSRKQGNNYETLIEPIASGATAVQSGDLADPSQKQSNQRLLDLRLVGQNLVMEGNTAIYPEIRTLNQAKREYLLSLYDFNTALTGVQENIRSPLIESLRVVKDAKGVHLRLRLKRDDLELVPFCEEKFCTIQLLVKASSQNLARFTNLEIDELDRQTTRLRLHSDKAFDYQIYPLENPQRLVIDTMGTKLTPGKSLERVLSNSQNIKNIRFAPTQTAQQTDIRLTLDLHGTVIYQFNQTDDYLEVLIQGRQRKPLLNVQNRRAFVVIDAGHGGNDPGAIGTAKTQEKKIALAVSEYLQHYLEGDNIQAVMTRSEDMEVLLQPRVDVANLRNADLFVSIHLNSMPPGNTHVRGIETYYTTPQSQALADTLHRYMIKELGAQDRRVRKRGLFVTRKTKMPSVLLEIGFLSSPEEEALLSNANYQRRVAKAIRDGIYDYLSKNKQLKPEI